MTIDGITPRQGPKSGGTLLAITGHFLNIGTKITAMLDDIPCRVNKTQSSSQRLVCITSSSNTQKEKQPHKISLLTVTIDNAVRMLRNPFTYTPDPRVLELKPLASPFSGGRIITVHGSYLDAVQSPKITVFYKETILNSSVCQVVSPSLMECPSPPVDEATVRKLMRSRRSANQEYLQTPEGISEYIRKNRRLRYLIYIVL